uniref:DNA-binding family protein n=1 Tax=Rhizophora mucronata TaxID=61149 RepID=A0A2P2MHD9_RHIMU
MMKQQRRIHYLKNYSALKPFNLAFLLFLSLTSRCQLPHLDCFLIPQLLKIWRGLRGQLLGTTAILVQLTAPANCTIARSRQIMIYVLIASTMGSLAQTCLHQILFSWSLLRLLVQVVEIGLTRRPYFSLKHWNFTKKTGMRLQSMLPPKQKLNVYYTLSKCLLRMHFLIVERRLMVVPRKHWTQLQVLMKVLALKLSLK